MTAAPTSVHRRTVPATSAIGVSTPDALPTIIDTTDVPRAALAAPIITRAALAATARSHIATPHAAATV